MHPFIRSVMLCWIVGVIPAWSFGQSNPPPQPVSVALLGVYEKGPDVKDIGPVVDSLLMASLSTRSELMLVERAELDKVISELELDLSGLVDPKSAAKIGYVTGAKVLVTAATFQVEGTLYVVAKVFGTETTRVFGVTAKGRKDRDLEGLAEKLAEDIETTILKRLDSLVVPEQSVDDLIANLKKKISAERLPVLAVSIPEAHIRGGMRDPAAETEFLNICKSLGFTIIDGKSPEAKTADIIVSGNAASEFAMQRQNLIGVRARVELVAKTKDDRLLVAERQTISKVGLTEQIAGKVAIEEATTMAAERFIPEMVEHWRKK